MQVIHRYHWPIRDAVETLLGDAVGDCDGWVVKVEGDTLFVDVVGPATASNETAKSYMALPEATDGPGVASAETGTGQRAEEDAPQAATAPAAESGISAEPRKQSSLATRAGIICAEKGFQVYVGAASEEEAAADIRQQCGVASRRDLDADDRAGRAFREIDRGYRAWLSGIE